MDLRDKRDFSDKDFRTFLLGSPSSRRQIVLKYDMRTSGVFLFGANLTHFGVNLTSLEVYRERGGCVRGYNKETATGVRGYRDLGDQIWTQNGSDCPQMRKNVLKSDMKKSPICPIWVKF